MRGIAASLLFYAGAGGLAATSPKERGPTETQPGRKAGTDQGAAIKMIAAAGIPEGFRLAESRRVAPRGVKAVPSCLCVVPRRSTFPFRLCRTPDTTAQNARYLLQSASLEQTRRPA